ncbi:Hypothetical protein A7982_08286 [Minicystis rosea]|nr:Hypothetical protein A7982_08286 [Minicystis rosea]
MRVGCRTRGRPGAKNGFRDLTASRITDPKRQTFLLVHRKRAGDGLHEGRREPQKA